MSFSVVDFMIHQYGRQKMTALLLQLRDGATADEALKAVYGFDVDGLEAAWRASVGARPGPGLPHRRPPQPRPMSRPSCPSRACRLLPPRRSSGRRRPSRRPRRYPGSRHGSTCNTRSFPGRTPGVEPGAYVYRADRTLRLDRSGDRSWPGHRYRTPQAQPEATMRRNLKTLSLSLVVPLLMLACVLGGNTQTPSTPSAGGSHPNRHAGALYLL